MMLIRSLLVYGGALLLLAVACPALAQADQTNLEPDNAAVLALDPDLMNGASRYQTIAQQLVADLLSDSDASIDELVEIIMADSADQVDRILINLADQTIYEMNANGHVLGRHPISSGKRGLDTPLGSYSVINKAPKAYSNKYESWMLHWMGLTRNGEYGMHGLEGSSYERLLGRVASHGCVRLSRDYAQDLYGRVHVGMPVEIVNQAELQLKDYEPFSREAAVAMVLQVISPADPWEIFY